MRKKLFLHACSVILSLTFSLSSFAETTKVLFHLHDAGETFALLPVIREMDDYLIVTSGVSRNLIKEIPLEHIRALDQLDQIEPQKVVTGVASELQGETLDYFRKKGIPTYAFWDNFSSEGPGAYFSRAHQIEGKADLLLLPSGSLLAAFQDRPCKVVGHPTLSQSLKPKLIVWIGGYGEEYEEAYALFQKGIAEVENCIVLVQHHPKTGLYNDLKTAEAIALADLVICHQSTAAFQALSQNKPVLHVIPEGQYFDSLPIQHGLALKVTKLEDFSHQVGLALHHDVSEFYELMGIPKNSVALILDEVR